MNIVGSLTNTNVTIIGLDGRINQILMNPDLKEHYYLAKSTLKDLEFDQNKVMHLLGLTKYLEATDIQNKVLANILDLIESGRKNLIFDELLMFIDNDVKKALMNFLESNNTKFINITSDMEETLFSDYLIVVYNGNVAIEGKTLNVLKEEKILNRLGYNLPFLVDLSLQLKYYGLVDRIYLNQSELVDKLWN